MKIGLIGNMNNNNFSLMRYFRDLGLDAHLLLFSNDGIGESQHFSPDSDSWDLKQWENYIHHLDFSEDPSNLFEFPLSIILYVRTFLRSIFYPNFIKSNFVTRKKILESFKDYDVLIGSGLTPSILNRVGLTISIYYPYSIGVEWYSAIDFLSKIKSNNMFTRIIAQKIAQKQSEGIWKARTVICFDKFLTGNVLKSIGVDPVFSMCPMLYNGEQLPTNSENIVVNKTTSRINESDFSVFSHVRHIWKRPNNITVSEWCIEDKNNDWLINAFSRLLDQNLTKKPLLILFEYGQDAIHSLKLCKELNIEKYVVWLPKLDRKNIMFLLSKIHVGVGEFYEIPKMMFGGTGYEVLASGKPLIQGFNFEDGSFENIYGIPSPPLLKVKAEDDVFYHLKLLASDQNKRIKIGYKSEKWFNKYCGQGLAEEWALILN